ncbi:hypothetical protein Tco_0255195 [Tanacetum coccineum]
MVDLKFTSVKARKFKVKVSLGFRVLEVFVVDRSIGTDNPHLSLGLKDRLPEGFDRIFGESYDYVFNQVLVLVFHMLVESKYPLTKEVLSQMLELKLETEEESSMALELIKFVRIQLEEFEDSNDDRQQFTSTHKMKKG